MGAVEVIKKVVVCLVRQDLVSFFLGNELSDLYVKWLGVDGVGVILWGHLSMWR